MLERTSRTVKILTVVGTLFWNAGVFLAGRGDWWLAAQTGGFAVAMVFVIAAYKRYEAAEYLAKMRVEIEKKLARHQAGRE